MVPPILTRGGRYSVPVDPDAPLSLAELAAKLFADGKPEEARALFAQALTPATTDLHILFLAFQFHFRSGEYDEAERLVRRRLALCGPDTDSEPTARAYTNLGLVLLYKKDLDAAESEFSRSVTISERIGDDFSLARALGNLALVPEARRDLDRAESLYLKALAISQRIGSEKLIAGNLANLGDIARWRSRPDEARKLWTEALGMYDRLGITMWRAELVQKLADLEKAEQPKPDHH